MPLENSEVLGQFVQIAVWVLGAVLLIIKIVQTFRRSPAVEQEFRSIADCTMYRNKNDGDNVRRDRESSDSRARLYNLIEQLRRDMDSGMRELGEQGAGQEKQIEMMNQRQIQMDQKIDALLRR
jgi:hypothetical protein